MNYNSGKAPGANFGAWRYGFDFGDFCIILFVRVTVITFSGQCMNGDKADLVSKTLRAAFNAIPGVAFVRDSEGVVLLANRLYASFFGLSPAEIEGKAQQDLYRSAGWHQPLLGKWLEEDRCVIASGEAIEMQEDITHVGGSVSKFRTSKIPIEIYKGKWAVLVYSEKRR